MQEFRLGQPVEKLILKNEQTSGVLKFRHYKRIIRSGMLIIIIPPCKIYFKGENTK